MRARIAGVSVWGPGLKGWAASRAVLAGQAPLVADDGAPPAPAMMAPGDRRRAGVSVRLALAAAQQATEMAGIPPGAIRSVFASSNGDGAVVHGILETLADGPGGGAVSPTQFHNSVHNAAAGYWTIASGSHEAATCLGCHDASAGMALLAAMAELTAEQVPVLLCLYDAPLPPPLDAKRPTAIPFAFGLVLTPPGDAAGERPAPLAEITVAYDAAPADPDAAWPRAPALAALARGNPAARGLALLEALASGRARDMSLAALDGRVDVSVRPL